MQLKILRGLPLLWAATAVPLCVAQVIDLPPMTTQPSGDTLSSADALSVRAFHFEGNTIFSSSRLADEVKSFVSRPITSDDLETARRKLTELYVNAGYITSGVVLPDQTVSDNVITFKIIEGRLGRGDVQLTGVDAAGNPRKLYLRNSYIINRILAGAGKVLNLLNLKERLEQLRQDANIRRINAELQPGAAPGESHLDVRVEENRPYHFSIDFNNRRPPSVGAEELTAHLSTTNLTGNGDSLSFDYTAMTGNFDRAEFSDLNNFGVDYAIPLNASDTTLEINFARSNSPVIEEPFENLNITSDTRSTALTLRQPIVRKTTAAFDEVDFDVFVTGSYRENHTELLGEPFSFTAGADDGTSRVTAIRLGQELNLRNQTQAISLRSTFGVGISAIDSTVHADGTADSQFFDWLGQAQYVRRLFNTNNQLIIRGAAQLSNDSLLSLEQFSLGGFDTVRGYRENAYVRDQAIAGTIELRLPVPGLPERDGVSILEVAPFFDIGYARDVHSAATNNRNTISSIGVGLLFHPNEHLQMQVYYGYPFKDTGTNSDLQDIGIHFDILVSAF